MSSIAVGSTTAAAGVRTTAADEVVAKPSIAVIVNPAAVATATSLFVCTGQLPSGLTVTVSEPAPSRRSPPITRRWSGIVWVGVRSEDNKDIGNPERNRQRIVLLSFGASLVRLESA